VTGRLSLQAMHRLNVRDWAADGEILIRLYPGDGPHGLQLQVLDPERLDVELNERYADGRAIKTGIEMDVYGRPVAYHILRQHPGEYGLWGQTQNRERERVPADQIIHAFVPEWP
jgi:capsid protein